MPGSCLIKLIKTPIGKLKIVMGENGALKRLDFADPAEAAHPVRGERIDVAALPAEMRACGQELQDFFDGTLTEFTVPLDLEGTDFQKRAWEALLTIPYGETRSYKDIARQIGNERATRAVGLANNRNPVAIIVPCHRVLGADGKLVGYGGGLWRKEWLIEHESAHAQNAQNAAKR